MSVLWLGASMLVLATGGFLALALAAERPGHVLLRRKPSPRGLGALRLAGWLLLALALACGMLGWGRQVGWVTWFGWLTMAGAGLIFALPSGERARAATDPHERRRKPTPPAPLLAPPSAQFARRLVMALLVAAPATFVTAAALWRTQPVLRADAIRSQVGPWTFTIAETDRRPPKADPDHPPSKAFQIRFCETCDDAIGKAYLSAGASPSPQDAALFDGDRWNRSVEMILPDTTWPDGTIWLIVEGKDGSLQQACWPITRLAPSTAAWLQARNSKD